LLWTIFLPELKATLSKGTIFLEQLLKLNPIGKNNKINRNRLMVKAVKIGDLIIIKEVV